MKIYACPKCGSRRIYMGTMDSGVIIGITSNNYICDDCGYQGMPFIFNSEREYKLFLKGLMQEIKAKVEKKDKEVEEISDDLKTKLSKTDEEIIDFLKELIDEKSDFKSKDKDEKPSHWHGHRSWWPEIIIAFAISTIIYIYSLPLILVQMDILWFIYYFIIFFLEALFILAAIVFIEYIFLFKFIRKN